MKALFTRRRIFAGAAAVAVAGVLAVEGPRLLRKRHAPSPFDDLLDRLDDRDAAAQIGEVMLAGRKNFNANAVAEAARKKLKHRKLADVALAEAAAGQMTEIGGWALPEILPMLYVLAAKAA